MPKLYPKSWGGFLIAVLRVVAAVYLLALALIFFFQERLIFFPSKLPADYQFHFGSPFEEKILDVSGSKIDTLLFTVPSPKGTIVYVHGNAGDLSTWGAAAEELTHHTGFNTMIFDYPGYGKSEGHISSEAQLNGVAMAVMKAARERAGLNARIIVFGRSIGTGIATKLAADTHPAALILESPYLNIASLAAGTAPWAPLFLLKYQFKSDENIRKVECPILIFHGTKDRVIPVVHGRLLSGIPQRTTFVEIPEGGHNDLGQYPEYWVALETFVKR